MKEDESVPEMFHRLQVLVNDLKSLGEEVKDKDFSHKFLRCLPARFGMLVLTLDFGRFWKMTGGPTCGKKGIRQTKQAVG